MAIRKVKKVIEVEEDVPVFLTHVKREEGLRGRSPLPKEHIGDWNFSVLNEDETELGEVIFSPQDDGSIELTVIIDGKRKRVEFPAQKKVKKARKVVEPEPDEEETEDEEDDEEEKPRRRNKRGAKAGVKVFEEDDEEAEDEDE